MGAVFFYLLPIRRGVAIANLDTCFPNKPYAWKVDIVKNCYKNLLINLFEFLYFPKLSKNKLNTLVEFHNHHAMEKAHAEGKGVILVSGHFSNWELTAFAYSKTYEKMNIIAKRQASRGLNDRINKYRELGGNEIIEIGSSLREVYVKLKDNEIVSFLIDQSAHPDYSVYVNFFGKNVATFAGPAKLALKYNVPVVLGYGIRNDDYTYDIYFEEIISKDLTAYNDKNITELTQRMQASLENAIKENPAQWLWFHKRFKHAR